MLAQTGKFVAAKAIDYGSRHSGSMTIIRGSGDITDISTRGEPIILMDLEEGELIIIAELVEVLL